MKKNRVRKSRDTAPLRLDNYLLLNYINAHLSIAECRCLCPDISWKNLDRKQDSGDNLPTLTHFQRGLKIIVILFLCTIFNRFKTFLLHNIITFQQCCGVEPYLVGYCSIRSCNTIIIKQNSSLASTNFTPKTVIFSCVILLQHFVCVF